MRKSDDETLDDETLDDGTLDDRVSGSKANSSPVSNGNEDIVLRNKIRVDSLSISDLTNLIMLNDEIYVVEQVYGDDGIYCCPPTRYDRVREELNEKTRKFYFYSWEVQSLVEHLGGSSRYDKIRADLRGKSIRPEDHGINQRKYHISPPVSVFEAGDVWDYLVSLERKGNISFQVTKASDGEEVTIQSINDLLKLGYHKNIRPLYMFLRSKIGNRGH